MTDDEMARELRFLADEMHELARKLEGRRLWRQTDVDATTDPLRQSPTSEPDGEYE